MLKIKYLQNSAEMLFLKFTTYPHNVEMKRNLKWKVKIMLKWTRKCMTGNQKIEKIT